MICFSSAGISGIGSRAGLCIAPSGPFHVTMLNLRELRALFGIVVAEMPAAAFLALDAARVIASRDSQQIVEDRARCASRGCIRGARRRRRAAARSLQRRQLSQRLLASRLRVRTMPTISCIISCRSFWTAYGFSPAASRSNGASGSRRRRFHLAVVDRARAVLLREFRRVLAGALAEDEQVGQRVAAEPIRAVDARRAFAAANRPGTVDICVSPSTRTPPMT